MKLNLKPFLFSVLLAAIAVAQTAPLGLEGDWTGTVTEGPNSVRVFFRIIKASDGIYLGRFFSHDAPVNMTTTSILWTGENVRIDVAAAKGLFQGAMSPDRTVIKGTWTQDRTLPLELTRMSPPDANTTPTKPVQPPDAVAPIVKDTGVPMRIDVPVAPIPVTGHTGEVYLVYELHMTNFSPLTMNLKRIDVLNGTASLATYDGGLLNEIVYVYGAGDPLDRRVLGPGLRAVAFVLVSIKRDAKAPAILLNRITVDGYSIEKTVRVLESKPIVLGPPLRGGNWAAGGGLSKFSDHRQALIISGVKSSISQRFAIDWQKTDANGELYSGDEKDNKAYYGYGSEVLAVAEATVVTAKDGIPDNSADPRSGPVPTTSENMAGNHVILDLGGRRFAFYAHLQPGLKVKLGDRVRRGQVIGLLGNSGDSPVPHLHFHMADDNSVLAAEGVPYVLKSFEVLRGKGAGPRRNALPLDGAIVKFD